jgi:uncharacterized membrane-anchored protein
MTFSKLKYHGDKHAQSACNATRSSALEVGDAVVRNLEDGLMGGTVIQCSVSQLQAATSMVGSLQVIACYWHVLTRYLQELARKS